MKKLKCLIVDDEELAQDIIEKYIESLPMLEVSGRCSNAVKAISYLYEHEIDLMFLDINMPEVNGLEMLRTLSNPPKTIITTAYSEFALESYDYGIVDYLLKPIKFDRFVRAVNKVIAQTQSQKVADPIPNEPKSLFIKEDHTTYGIEFDKILFVEAYGNYLKIHTDEKMYVVRETLQHILDKLPEKQFIKIHKSYIVSIEKIKKIVGNIVYLQGHEIPVGSTFKSELAGRIYG